MTEAEVLSRLRRLEDQQAIAKLIASYGPSVDAGNADRAADLWAVDGTYDVEGWQMTGRHGIHEMVSSTSHQALVAQGCCHFLGPAVVTVEGDTAVAVCESLVLLRQAGSDSSGSDGQYRVWRATANHFVLNRIADQWQITTRTSRILDGDPYAHVLLEAGLDGTGAPPG
ncbi:nuclear transport factor 2 family protein [Mycobacterium sp. 360MFTsu5.1]|uniref:nuclear transport factor 2 family protein n=1 Tax=Mycobacterium sp. 360MFTsu5.1 TaxID=1172186 RepID=UPI00036FD088|nr:nuclear transport factor 2 family protein [Mycobacterium sp. 360MFTsu5.1]